MSISGESVPDDVARDVLAAKEVVRKELFKDYEGEVWMTVDFAERVLSYMKKEKIKVLKEVVQDICVFCRGEYETISSDREWDDNSKSWRHMSKDGIPFHCASSAILLRITKEEMNS